MTSVKELKQSIQSKDLSIGWKMYADGKSIDFCYTEAMRVGWQRASRAHGYAEGERYIEIVNQPRIKAPADWPTAEQIRSVFPRGLSPQRSSDSLANEPGYYEAISSRRV